MAEEEEKLYARRIEKEQEHEGCNRITTRAYQEYAKSQPRAGQRSGFFAEEERAPDSCDPCLSPIAHSLETYLCPA